MAPHHRHIIAEFLLAYGAIAEGEMCSADGIEITKNPYITQREQAKVCGITEDDIYWHIKRLKESGTIRRIGPNKGGHRETANNDVK